MKNFSTWLLVMFMVLYWIFRVVVALMFSFGKVFVVAPLDLMTEIILLFVALICIILIARRKLFGAFIYLFIYGWYFGMDLYNTVMVILEGTTDINTMLKLASSGIAIILPIAILFDLLLDRNRKAHPVDKKTDWFYKNKEYDREMDERADKNNYRL